MPEEPNIMDVVGTGNSHHEKAGVPSPMSACNEEGPQSKSDERSKKDVSCWAVSDDTFFGVGSTVKTMPPGCYDPRVADSGPYLVKIPIVTDDLLVMPDDASNFIIDDFEQFWTMKDRFKARGFLHKRGILMWGPPGSGKTSTIQLLIKKIVEDIHGIVLMVNRPQWAVKNLQMIRKIEPDRPVICILEDLDALVSDHGESSFLALLDGEAQVDNIVFLSTTNYPERLDARFVDRPSRFDIVKYIGMPSPEARKYYLENKENSWKPGEIAEWVDQTDGLTIPHLKEMIISVKCYGRSLEETVARLRAMHKKKFKSETDTTLGFAPTTSITKRKS